MAYPVIKLLRLSRFPIYHQLVRFPMEETLCLVLPQFIPDAHRDQGVGGGAAKGDTGQLDDRE